MTVVQLEKKGKLVGKIQPLSPIKVNPLNAHPVTTRKSLNAESVKVAVRINEPRDTRK